MLLQLAPLISAGMNFGSFFTSFYPTSYDYRNERVIWYMTRKAQKQKGK